MAKHILIIGSGFAGMMAALGASKLRHEAGASPEELVITVVSPEPAMIIRPRLYERDPHLMTAPLSDLFAATDIEYVQGWVEAIDATGATVTATGSDQQRKTLPFDRLVLAAGSHGYQPPIPGLAEHGYSASLIEEAVKLDQHLSALASQPSSVARNTVVVGGAGFTGLEIATEMPSRLREILGDKEDIRVVIVDRAERVAPDMGEAPIPYIQDRLKALGIESRMGSGIASLDTDSVTLQNGERIETSTVIWAAGMRASPLTAQLSAERDPLGRIITEADLRVPGVANVFATGDTAKAVSDKEGRFCLVSCQHARRLGAFAGHNAAADLLGEPTLPYDQPTYVTCLDLGQEDAIFTRGFSNIVEITGEQAKSVKMEINTVWIYPPAADRTAAYENVLHARTADF